MPSNWLFFLIKSLGYILAIQICHFYGTNATVPYVSTPQFGTVVTRKMAGLVQYRSSYFTTVEMNANTGTYRPEQKLDDAQYFLKGSFSRPFFPIPPPSFPTIMLHH
jgi:hypothetical protein